MPLAMLTLEGRPAVELPDHHGEVHAYLVDVHPVFQGWRCFGVRRHRAEPGEHTYTVRTNGREWRCDCPAYKFCRTRPHTCKHCQAVAEFDQLLRALAS